MTGSDGNNNEVLIKREPLVLLDLGALYTERKTEQKMLEQYNSKNKRIIHLLTVHQQIYNLHRRHTQTHTYTHTHTDTHTYTRTHTCTHIHTRTTASQMRYFTVKFVSPKKASEATQWLEQI